MAKAAETFEKVLKSFPFIKEIIDELTGEKAAAEQDLVNLTYGRGLLILDERAKSGQTLQYYLQRHYFALYLIGRSGHRLAASKRQDLSIRMVHFHSQLLRNQDVVLVQWYQTQGPARRISLSKMLSVCPEIIELNIDSKFIAYALGENLDLDFKDLRADLERFK